MTQDSSIVILRLFYSTAAHFIPADCTVVLVEVISQLPICIFAKLNILETFQLKFIRAMLAVPRCIMNAVLELRAGLVPENPETG